MSYEIDFIGVNEHTKDALAVCFRWYNERLGRYLVAVYDGGFKIHGEALVRHLKKHYFPGEYAPTIDLMICSHSDDDHAAGLVELFDHFNVKNLIVNRPWEFSDELFQYVYDGRRTKNSVEEFLKEKYSSIATLEEKARNAGTKIHSGFTTTKFGPDFPLKILSPTKEMYLELIVESYKTPYKPKSFSTIAAQNISEATRKIVEWWFSDGLRDDVSTSAENETSIVVLGDMDSEMFLLTGDAGIRALDAAATYAENIGIDLKSVSFHQIPHHGGRHNVSTEILNRIVGPVVSENSTPTKSAFVSIGKDSDHPKGMVTNAYIRRGVNVYEARASVINHRKGEMPKRAGWVAVTKIDFLTEVEDWN